MLECVVLVVHILFEINLLLCPDPVLQSHKVGQKCKMEKITAGYWQPDVQDIGQLGCHTQPGRKTTSLALLILVPWLSLTLTLILLMYPIFQ